MLDLFFRKYAWTANLVLLFAAAWLSAKTVNTLVGVLIRPRPEVDLSRGDRAAPARAAARLASTPTGSTGSSASSRPQPVEVPGLERAADAARTATTRAAPPTKSDLRMQLVAGVIADRPRYSLATVNDLATRETHVLGVGRRARRRPAARRRAGARRPRRDRQRLPGRRDHLQRRDEGVPRLRARRRAPAPRRPGRTSASRPCPARAPGAPGPGRRIGGDPAGSRTTATRSTASVLDSTLSRPQQGRDAGPHRPVLQERRRRTGSSSSPSSRARSTPRSASRTATSIQRVNGYEINSPDKALELYQKLRGVRHVTIEVERGGQVITQGVQHHRSVKYGPKAARHAQARRHARRSSPCSRSRRRRRLPTPKHEAAAPAPARPVSRGAAARARAARRHRPSRRAAASRGAAAHRRARRRRPASVLGPEPARARERREERQGRAGRSRSAPRRSASRCRAASCSPSTRRTSSTSSSRRAGGPAGTSSTRRTSPAGRSRCSRRRRSRPTRPTPRSSPRSTRTTSPSTPTGKYYKLIRIADAKKNPIPTLHGRRAPRRRRTSSRSRR